MKLVAIVVLALFLLGCERLEERFLPNLDIEPTVPPPPPARLGRPILAVVENESIRVEMDDGQICLGSAGDAFASNGWSGTLTECEYAYPYAVELAVGTLPDQIFVEPVATSGIIEEKEVQFRPFATVIVTDTVGETFRFESAGGF